MDSERLRFSDLSDHHFQRWQQLREQSAALASPFFSPRYFQVISQFRKETEVLVLSRGGRIEGFLPFEQRGRIAYPAGAEVSEITGCVTGDATTFDLASVLASHGIAGWVFDCVDSRQAWIQPWAYAFHQFRQIDLSCGMEHYCKQQKRQGSKAVEGIQRKRRKLERERGGLHFCRHDNSDEAFEWLLQWKRAQYQRTGVTDVLSIPWVEATLRFLKDDQPPDRLGGISSLRVNQQIVATAFWLGEGGRTHLWFPTYCPKFAKYSPGQILLLSLIEDAARTGERHVIELGQGDERYKLSLGNQIVHVAEGLVTNQPIRFHTRKLRTHLRIWAEKNPACQVPLRMLRRRKSYRLRNQT